jgi:hypothetical protein
MAIIPCDPNRATRLHMVNFSRQSGGHKSVAQTKSEAGLTRILKLYQTVTEGSHESDPVAID